MAQILLSKRARPFTVHCSLLIFVLIYTFVGGLIFNKLESRALIAYRSEQVDNANRCVYEVLRTMRNLSATSVTLIERCWKTDTDDRAEWNYVTSTLYGFGIVTTLGYNRIAPITLAGRMFCIVYGLCGIPITMITIANVGRYLNSFAKKCRKKIDRNRLKFWRKKDTMKSMKICNGSDCDDDDTSAGFASLILLIAFLFYVAFGAILLPFLNGEGDFVNGLYYNFLCLTAIDFGQLVPREIIFLPITFIYVCVGLAITTIAIDVGSDYVRKLHYIGKKMKNVATTKIWMKVRDLLHEVGNKCGVEPCVIDKIDLDGMVESMVAKNEGRSSTRRRTSEKDHNVKETCLELLAPDIESNFTDM